VNGKVELKRTRLYSIQD